MEVHSKAELARNDIFSNAQFDVAAVIFYVFLLIKVNMGGERNYTGFIAWSFFTTLFL